MSIASEFTGLPSSEQAQGVRDVIARAGAADGTAPVSEQVIPSLTRDSDARHLIRTVDDTVIGYANLVPAPEDHPAMAEVVVDPAHRGQGLGGELVDAALTAGGLWIAQRSRGSDDGRSA